MMSEIRIGMLVNYHSIIGGPVTSTGHKVTKLQILLDGRRFVWISRKCACVAWASLSPSEPVEDLEVAKATLSFDDALGHCRVALEAQTEKAEEREETIK